ncbi:MAG: GNAT family N-acetyltransferase [Christensenellaceae bacterium]|jgi:ribosomal-protein-alanine N-acetyltransferase
METQRLILRRFEPADAADLYEYLSDPLVTKYEPYEPFSYAQCEATAKERAENDAFWAVCLKENKKCIGNVYLAKGEQDNWTLGYVFSRAFQKKGYATEACRALITHIFTGKQAHRIEAYCNPQNTASYQLLERLTFRREGHFLKNVYFHIDEHGAPLWQDTYYYALLKEEWNEQSLSQKIKNI